MKIENLKSKKSGRPVANQFIIRDDDGNEWFQSYNSIIGKEEPDGTITLDPDYMNYSRTTSRYLYQWLQTNSKDFKSDIRDGDHYKLAPLNGQEPKPEAVEVSKYIPDWDR